MHFRSTTSMELNTWKNKTNKMWENAYTFSFVSAYLKKDSPSYFSPTSDKIKS